MTSERPSILIVSNGRGEDAVGAAVARQVLDVVTVSAFPLVGLGETYADIPLLEPRRTLPSGGFALRGAFQTLMPDLRAGAVPLWWEQRRALRAQAGRYRLVIAIGDVYGLWMASRAGTPAIFVATAKSEYNERHRLIEILAVRRHARTVFARDERTAEALRRRGIAARFTGNPLVDVIPEPQDRLPVPPGAPVVLLLPGSRLDAIHNTPNLLRLCRRVARQEPATFVAAIPPTLEMAAIVRMAVDTGWSVDGAFLHSLDVRVLLTRDFGSSVRIATTVVGVAGTANEQAAALGVPVVAFPPPGAVQYTPRFLRLQHRLLGDALMPARDWEGAAEITVRLLRDPQERARRGAIGRERMGPGGAVPAIAAEVRTQCGVY